jgi:hypothetical protein
MAGLSSPFGRMQSFTAICRVQYNRTPAHQVDSSQEVPMSEPTRETGSAPKPADGQLNSWKEIAAYFSRDVTTVQRWEKREGMPVHRHLHDKMGSVYAFRAELATWARSRNVKGEEESTAVFAVADPILFPETVAPAHFI